MSIRSVRVLAFPLVVFALVGGVFGAVKPGVARSALASPQAVLITAGVLALTVAVTYATLRGTRREWLAAAAGLVPVVAFLAYTIAPVYRNVEVNDANAVLPAAAGADGGDTPAAAGAPNGGAPAAGDARSGGGAGAQGAGTPAAGSTAPSARTAPEPQVLGRGTLSGVNHRASGTAYLLLDPSTGALSVVLARLDVEPGPDYEVHLVPGRGTTRPNGVRLAHLKGNRGTQSYPVPAGTATGGPISVLIWCRAFAVPIAVAPLG